MYYDSAYYGMHFGWWIFWLVCWVCLFSFWMPVRRGRWQDFKETPLAVLNRRLAKGEIKEQEYERLKDLLAHNNG